ncbi:hypothetical protein STEG23_032739, partial [Scotinomys teguina]
MDIDGSVVRKLMAVSVAIGISLSSTSQPSPFKDSPSSCVFLRLESSSVLSNFSQRSAQHLCVSKLSPLQVPIMYVEMNDKLLSTVNLHVCVTSVGHCRAEHEKALAVIPFS